MVNRAICDLNISVLTGKLSLLSIIKNAGINKTREKKKRS